MHLQVKSGSLLTYPLENYRKQLEPSLDCCFPRQANQASQHLFIPFMLQPPKYLVSGPWMQSLVNIALVLESWKLDTVLQMWTQKGWVERTNHFSGPVCCSLLLQHKMWWAFVTAKASCELLLNFLSTMTPKSSSTNFLLSQSVSQLLAWKHSLFSPGLCICLC